MKRIKIVVLSCLLFALIINITYAQKPISKKNIEKFKLSAFTGVTNSVDTSIVLVYMQIPNNALQFIKVDKLFVAHFEATIALQTKKGKQIDREVWQDSIVTKSYTLTNSLTASTTLMASFKVSAGKYNAIGSLLDFDTKKSGKISRKIDLSEYKNKQFIHKPILLNKSRGDWGFSEGLIPAINNSTFELEDGLTFYISGKVIPGDYELVTSFLDKKGKELFTTTISDTLVEGTFEHLISLPVEYIEGMRIKVRTELAQKNDIISTSADISVRKPGISAMISDLGDALEQMRYILDAKERKAIKKVSVKNQDKLFRKLWKRRDPTPDSEINELMNEYYNRVAFSNTHFDSFLDGWESDMGMIYIIFGIPDDIERSILSQSNNTTEIWYYYGIQKTFSFIDRDGFGQYILTTPYLGYRR